MDLRLRAEMPQRVTIPGAGLTLDLAHGEEIRVEISTKFRREQHARRARRGRLRRRAHVDRRRGDFALTLARRERLPSSAPPDSTKRCRAARAMRCFVCSACSSRREEW